MYYRDADNDTYGDPDDAMAACVAPEGYVDNSTGFDCDDFNSAIHMGCEANPCTLKIVPRNIFRLFALENQSVPFVVYASRKSGVIFSEPINIEWTTDAIENGKWATIGKRIIIGILVAHPNKLIGGEFQAIVSYGDNSAQECFTIDVK